MGSPPTPYIFDDRCDWEDVADQLRVAFDMGKTERARRGQLGREWVMGDESYMSSRKMGELFVKNMGHLLKMWRPKEPFKLYTENDKTEDQTITLLNSML